MEHQVQSLVFVDGEWVQRTTDVFQIMSRNQQHEDTAMREPDAKLSQQIPSLGILSRTVIETPYTRFVLSANIRHKDLNDFVLIGENSIQLNEICDYGHLRHIATKSLKAKIMAARVFGTPRRVNSSLEKNPLLNRPTVHRPRRSTAMDEEITLPPEIIVLTLSSRTLMFLWATHDQTAPVTFRQKTIRLPPGHSRFDQLGPHLAVDRKGRAIAVAAHEGRFILYKTKPPQVWQDEVRRGQDGLPLVDEAIIQLEGRVMHMDFLASDKAQDDPHIILVFILVHRGNTMVACYDWDTRVAMDESTARKVRFHVDFNDRNPSLLIPLSKGHNFLLVSDHHVTLYDRVLAGPSENLPTPVPDYMLRQLRPGDNKRSPRYVQWDRAVRNPGFSKESFYVVREDGAVMYLEYEDHTKRVEITEAGRWPHPIDTAFACLDIDNNSEFSQTYPDMLVSGGAGSDGLLCKVGPWPKEELHGEHYVEAYTFSFIENIPSWAPLADMTATQLPGIRTPHERERASIFVTNGKAPEGELTELRHGLKAIVDDSFGGMKGCTGVWIVDHGVLENESKQHYATFIFTLPLETIVIRATRVAQGTHGEGIWDKIQLFEDDSDHIIRSEETIAACCWTEEYTIQITRREARVLRRPHLAEFSSTFFQSPLLGAATKPSVPFIVVSYRTGNRAILEAVPISPTRAIGPTYPLWDLPCDPTKIELMTFDGDIFVFVSTIDGSISLIKLEKNGSFTSVYETHLGQEYAGGPRMLCESAVLLSGNKEIRLLCGTRDGFITSTSLTKTGNSESQNPHRHRALMLAVYQPTSKGIVKMGSTAVKITSSATDPLTAFAACGPDFCRIRCSTPTTTSHKLDIDSIWLVDRRNPAYAQGPITALDQLPIASGLLQRDLGGFMFAVSGEQMVIAQLDYDVRWSNHDIPPASLEQSKVVPRKIPTGATPQKMMYMEGSLHNMVVATIENKVERRPPNGYRTLVSTLKFIKLYDDNDHTEELDVKEEESIPASLSNRFTTWEFALEPYERVYSIVEWTYSASEKSGKTKKHHIILLGTGIMTGPNGEEHGRRLFFNTGKHGKGMKLIKAFSHSSPVRCMAVLDNTHLVSVIGVHLRIYEFIVSDGQWPICGTVELPSMGVHITISGAFIHVSTTHDGHVCYRVRPGLDGKLRIEKVFTDSRERALAHHLIVDLNHTPTASDNTALPEISGLEWANYKDNLVLLTDKTCTVTGLYHKDIPTLKLATETLFEAELPRSVIRIARADIRPPWRRPCALSDASTSSKRTDEGISCRPAGVLADDIVGACTDGTIYAFSILTLHARRLLRLLQNIIHEKNKRDPQLQFTSVKPRSGDIFHMLQNGAEGVQGSRIRARDVDPEVFESGGGGFNGVGGGGGARANAVDGDFLSVWFESAHFGGVRGEGVRQLVEDGCEEGVRELLIKYAHAVLMESGSNGSVESSSAFEWVENWLTDMLMPLL